MWLTGIVGPKWEEFELAQNCPKRARKDRKKRPKGGEIWGSGGCHQRRDLLLKEKGGLQGWVETASLIKYSNSVQAHRQQNRLERERVGGPEDPQC